MFSILVSLPPQTQPMVLWSSDPGQGWQSHQLPCPLGSEVPSGKPGWWSPRSPPRTGSAHCRSPGHFLPLCSLPSVFQAQLSQKDGGAAGSLGRTLGSTPGAPPRAGVLGTRRAPVVSTRGLLSRNCRPAQSGLQVSRVPVTHALLQPLAGLHPLGLTHS